MIDWPAKEAAEVADYSVDFASKLADGETIASKVVTATGVTKDSDAIDGTAVKVWLSAGTEGTLAKIVVTVTTSGGRTYTELALLPIGGGPISMARAKAHLRVDWDDDDALIAAYLRASVGAVERRTDRALSPQAFTEWAARFPCGYAERLTLARDPISEIISVTYVDVDGAEQELDTADYRSIEGEPWSLIAPVAGSFPATEERPDAVRVRYMAGYEAGECPAELQSAVLLMLGHLYANREAVAVGANVVTPMPFAVDMLCEPFRRTRLG
jgi:uncharacterized phiE125 gp8 family phage protein